MGHRRSEIDGRRSAAYASAADLVKFLEANPCQPRNGAIKRVFVDWSRPLLPQAAREIHQRLGTGPDADWSKVLLVVPGARAGRRLLELLIDIAEADDRLMEPPRIVTIGRLAETLSPPVFPRATSAERLLAWGLAIRELPSDLFAALFSRFNESPDLSLLMAMAGMLDRWRSEFASDGWTWADVHARLCETRPTIGVERYTSLARLEALYEAKLAQAERTDGIGWKRSRPLVLAEVSWTRLFMIGVVDFGETTVQLLDAAANKGCETVAFVHAPEDEEAHFDADGRVRVNAWNEYAIPIDDANISVVDGPIEQASTVLDVLSRLPPERGVDEVVVGAPEAELIPTIEALLESARVPTRSAQGIPLEQTAPYRWLKGLADYLRDRRFASLARLLRHPDVEHEIARRWRRRQQEPIDWLTLLDEYRAEHLPERVGDEWLSKPAENARLRWLAHAIHHMAGDLAQLETRAMREWARPILDALLAVYGKSKWRRDDERERRVIEACEAIHETLVELHELPDALAVSTTALEALDWVLEQWRDLSVAEPAGEPAVEILGWLELALDDAPIAIITSVHEGLFASGGRADAFLPHSLRQEIGLATVDRRHARDVYWLTTILHSKEDVTFITARRAVNGDPTFPSRLMLSCAEDALPTRAMRLFGPTPSDQPRFSIFAPPREPSIRLPGPPMPKDGEGSIESLRVTAFREYLACPYRFYLGQVLRLASMDDDVMELDGAQFGSLTHAVLARFGAGDSKDSDDPEVIARFLIDALRDEAAVTFGSHPNAVVRLQLEMLRDRMVRAAQVQAEWRRQGWRIERVEQSAPLGSANLITDGRPFFLLGRLDRIDIHEGTGAVAVLDYKTSETALSPRKAHQSRSTWVDLQLPLYRHLTVGLGHREPAVLAYFNLPKDLSQAEIAPADWTKEELSEADEVARSVIRGLRDNVFWPMSESRTMSGEIFAAICQDERLALFDEGES